VTDEFKPGADKRKSRKARSREDGRTAKSPWRVEVSANPGIKSTGVSSIELAEEDRKTNGRRFREGKGTGEGRRSTRDGGNQARTEPRYNSSWNSVSRRSSERDNRHTAEGNGRRGGGKCLGESV